MTEKKVAKVKKDFDTCVDEDEYDVKQCRNWCFTDWFLSDYEELYNNYKDIIRYICWGKETGKKSGKEHHQGWVQFKNKKAKGGVLRLFNFKGKPIYFRACRGDEYSNEIYCKKDGNFKSFGKFTCQGERSDLEAIQKKLDDGAPLLDIAKDHFKVWCNNHNAFAKYKEMTLKENTKAFRKLEVEVIQGETGSGKTRKAMEEAEYKIEGDSLQWWDGYNGEKTIVIDEYSNQLPITKLLNILDGYQLRLPIKGGHTYANWNKVIITTNNEWEEWHEHAKPLHRNALLRRITKWTIL